MSAPVGPMRNLTVLHVAETLPGGPATHLQELLPFQVEEHESVSVFCREEHAALIRTAGVNVISVKGVNRTPIGLLTFAMKLNYHLRTNRYDIVHLHSTYAGLIGRLIPKRGFKIVYCARGWAFTMRRAEWLLSIYGLVERMLSVRADSIINISDSEHSAALAHNLPADRMSVIYNGVADKGHHPRGSAKSERIKLLFVGRFDEQKGLDVLIAAWPKLRSMGYDLTLVGAPAVRKYHRLDIPADVKDLGWLEPSAVSKQMAAADALIVPSRWEGFGFVAIEAMSIGRPVLASDVGGLSEIVVDGVTGIKFNPNSVDAIVAAGRRLLDSDISRLGLASRARYEELYSARRMYEQIQSVYASVMDRQLAV